MTVLHGIYGEIVGVSSFGRGGGPGATAISPPWARGGEGNSYHILWCFGALSRRRKRDLGIRNDLTEGQAVLDDEHDHTAVDKSDIASQRRREVHQDLVML